MLQVRGYDEVIREIYNPVNTELVCYLKCILKAANINERQVRSHNKILRDLHPTF